MKVIAFYLPQFHEIPENNAWWGDGFTEWVNVKKATPLSLNKNYYNLLNPDTMKWQDALAQKYGVYGFCFYHYWFDGHKLLEKPVEMYLDDSSLKTHYCICWANEHWTNAWSGGEAKVLIEQRYGEKKEWKQHFDYFLPFFKDKRYILENGKPILVIYRPEIIGCLNEMLDYWNELAVENGFPGIAFAYQHVSYTVLPNCDESRFSYAIEYHPSCARTFKDMEKNASLKSIKKTIVNFFEDKLKIDLRELKKKMNPMVHFSYDEVWNYIINMKPRNEKCVPGAFVDWDNTPRRGDKGFVCDGATPEKFEKYLTQQIVHARKDYHKDMLFVFSWNEWAEGGYLEPDEHNGYGYLEAVHNALENTNELEK